MSDKPLYFLINTRSGGVKAQAILDQLRLLASDARFNIIVDQFDPALLSKQVLIAKQVSTIIVGGGDGTVASVLSLFAGTSINVGIIPLGTGNDLARELGLVARLRSYSVPQMITYFRFATSRELFLFSFEYGAHFTQKVIFSNYVSFGFDAKVVADFSKIRAHPSWSSVKGVWTNRAAYAAASLMNLQSKIRGTPRLTNANNDQIDISTSCKSLLFANIRSMMGIGISNPHSNYFDQNIEALSINNLFSYSAMLFNYAIPVLQPQYHGSSQAWEIHDMPIDCPLQIDGEPRPDIRSSQFRIRAAEKVSVLLG